MTINVARKKVDFSKPHNNSRFSAVSQLLFSESSTTPEIPITLTFIIQYNSRKRNYNRTT